MRRVTLIAAFVWASAIGSADALGQASCTPFPYQAPLYGDPPALVDIRRAHVDVRVDSSSHSVSGRITYEMLLSSPLDSLVVVSSGARIDSVFGGESDRPSVPLAFQALGRDSVSIRTLPLFEEGDVMDSLLYLAIDFESLNTRVDDSVAWTLTGDATWFPRSTVAWDRFETSMNVAVPATWAVSAPGVQTGMRANEDGSITIQFASPHPLEARHIDFIAGIFEPQTVFAELSAGRRVAVSFLDGIPDPRVMEYIGALSSWLRFDYPFERYAHVSGASGDRDAGAGLGVHPASHGTSALGFESLSDDARIGAHIAQQWIGAVVSAANPTDSWLELAIPAYLGLLVSGSDMDAALRDLQRLYFAEAERYVRPLVWPRWNHPSELNDAHAVAKGVWVLHLLRHRIGETAFQDAIRHFVQAHPFSGASTEDFIASAAEVSSADLDEFATQWIFGAGHPVIRASYERVEDGVLLRIEQVQSGEAVPEAFDLELAVEVGSLGSMERFTVSIEERIEHVVLPFDAQPRFLALDPEAHGLLEAEVDQPPGAWVAQLRGASTKGGRLAAARALASVDPDPALLLGLRSALDVETDPNVRAAVVDAIANVGSEAAERAVFELFDDPAPAVRRAVLRVLPRLANSERSIQMAVTAAEQDTDPDVQAQAVVALARLGAEQAVDIARAALITPSPGDVVLQAGLSALTLLHNRAPGVALSAGLAHTEGSHATATRLRAIELLRELAPLNREAMRRLRDLLGDRLFEIRTAAARALADIGAVEILSARIAEEPSIRSRTLLSSLIPCPKIH